MQGLQRQWSVWQNGKGEEAVEKYLRRWRRIVGHCKHQRVNGMCSIIFESVVPRRALYETSSEHEDLWGTKPKKRLLYERCTTRITPRPLDMQVFIAVSRGVVRNLYLGTAATCTWRPYSGENRHQFVHKIDRKYWELNKYYLHMLPCTSICWILMILLVVGNRV